MGAIAPRYCGAACALKRATLRPARHGGRVGAVSAAARLTPALTRVVVLAALACGAGTIALLAASDHQDAKAVWAIFGPAVGWSFIGTGLYAWRRRPESRSGELMVALGFAWFLSALGFSNSPLVYTIAFVLGGLWGGVFLQLVVAFPSGRLAPGRDRVLVIAGYLIFTVASIPAMLFASPHDLGCDGCPDEPADGRARREPRDGRASASSTLLYAVLFVLVARAPHAPLAAHAAARAPPADAGLRLRPGDLPARDGRAAPARATPRLWAGYAATALLPFAFLAGLLRSHVAWLDAQLRARLEELRASRARLVEAGDTERRRLERDLHDGAQARLRRRRAPARPRAPARCPATARSPPLLDRALDELQAGLAELRELARGIHPPVLTEQGLEPALSRWPRARPCRWRSPPTAASACRGPVEIAAYFVVSEALANVVKYAQASEATRRGRPLERHRDGRRRRRRRGRRGCGARVGAARPRRPASPRSTARSPSTAPSAAGRACTWRSRRAPAWRPPLAERARARRRGPARPGGSTPPCPRASPPRCASASSSPRPRAPRAGAALDEEVAAHGAHRRRLAVDEGVHRPVRERERADGVEQHALRCRRRAAR